ncbi:hypothetical protein EG850_13150 [Gulosibacter macacae]|uniref:LPXTG cell wall anchor domain-containing protein n=1 Tax=Gulosibacter macacae TaxID=2488791 RepID=A0A3P3VV84_9MICO|nr:hypothetical protein EG850_13150 [Gulosibacter macacae]
MCAGPDGWTAERAVELGVTVEIGGETISGQDGGWTVYNENNDGVLRTWFTVVNPPVEPEATEEVPVEEPTEETAQPVPPVNVAESSTPTLTPETATPVASEHLAATGADEFAPIGLAAAAILAAGAMLLWRRSATQK